MSMRLMLGERKGFCLGLFREVLFAGRILDEIVLEKGRSTALEVETWGKCEIRCLRILES